jgi:hypothetical protein
VRDEETTVLLPLEPLASTVILTMRVRIRRMRVEEQAFQPREPIRLLRSGGAFQF